MTRYIKPLPAARLEFQMFVLDELADELIEQGKDVIKITIGVAEMPVPDRILKVFAETIYDHKKTHLVYPEGLPELREAIANYYNTQFKVDTTSHQVFINVGTSSVFRNLFQLLSCPGGSAAPTWGTRGSHACPRARRPRTSRLPSRRATGRAERAS